jgi:hypothetical protein
LPADVGNRPARAARDPAQDFRSHGQPPTRLPVGLQRSFGSWSSNRQGRIRCCEQWRPDVRAGDRLGSDVVPVEPADPRTYAARSACPTHRAARARVRHRVPSGYGSPQYLDQLATAASPLAGLILEDCAEHTLGIIWRIAEHGPGRSSGPQPRRQHPDPGRQHRPGTAGPDPLPERVLLRRFPTVLAYAPTAPAPDSALGRARRISFLGQPGHTWVSRINPRTTDPDVLAVQHALLMADLNPAQVPAVLAYATQPDEPLQVVVADARLTPRRGDGSRAPSQPATMPRSHNPQRSPTSLPPRVPPSRGLRHDQKLKRPRAAAVR